MAGGIVHKNNVVLMFSNSLSIAFDAQCEAGGDRPAYVFLRDDLSVAEQLSYRALSGECHALARRLAAVAGPGDRVLLALPPGLDFVRSFWACVLAGCVAVPVPAPDPVRLLHGAPRLRGILDDAGATLVLTSSSLLDAARNLLEPAMFVSARWMTVPQLQALPAGPAVRSRVDARAVAYLQYTSGSTTAPRGVRLTHANVLANVRALNDAWRVGPGSRFLTWMPLFHDYGLMMGVLLPLCAGAASWLMSPLTFLRRPLRWVEAMGAFGITHSAAPESAYAACLRALDGRPVTAELSSLVALSSGAEPIRPETVERIAEVFGAAGMRPGAFAPAYGLAESVLVVSASRADRPARILCVDASALQADRVVVRPDGAPGARRVVGCGRPLADTAVAIVSPDTGAPVPDRTIGEIWVGSPSVGDGYWAPSSPGNAGAAGDVFGAHLPDGTGPWLRTGDLGFVHEGEVFVTGRLKDLVIVHGSNHYPQDLEWTAEQADPALRRGYGAAFAVDTADGEALVLLLETERRSAAVDADGIARAVRRAIGEVHGLPVEVVALVRSGSLPRSSSGKIQRRLCRKRYLEGRLDVQAIVARDGAEPPAMGAGAAGMTRAQGVRTSARDATEQALWAIWSEVLDTAAFGVHESFFELGGDSLRMTQVASRIDRQLGVELPIAALFEHTSVAALAAHLRPLLRSRGSAGATGPLIEQVPRRALLPVSLSQRRMWVIQQFDPASSAYNVGLAFRLRGPLDAALLQRAFDRMIERHEGLRTRFVQGAHEPMQSIEPALAVAIETIDLGAHADRVAHARMLLSERMARPFDLARAPLLRLALLRLEAREHVLLWVMHHTIADNWSFVILLRELLAIYHAAAEGREPALAPVSIGYADYAAWQRRPEAAALRRPQMDYWRERLAGLAPLDLPTDFDRPGRSTFRGRRVSAALPPALRSALRDFCARQSVTPFIAMLAAFKLMLARQTHAADIAVGTPVANRNHFVSEHLVGTLVNTLVMRTDLSGDPAFADLVQRVRRTAVEAYANQEAPFDELVESLGTDRTLHPETLVRVLFNMLNAPLGELGQGGLAVDEFDFERTSAQFDLSVHIDTEFTQRIHFEYSTDLYAHATIERMLENYLALLGEALAQPSRPLSGFAIVSPAERALLREGWNGTSRILPAALTVHRYLESAHAARPEAIAAVDAAGTTLSYRELRARSNALARALRARGIGRGQRVGLGMARDAAMLVALLGVLKSGAAYVPLDPGFPPDRLRFMAEDAGLSALLTRGVPADWLAGAGLPVLRLDDGDGGALLAGHSGADLPADAHCDAGPLDAAYMIYTSGSTGHPKGVVVPHRGVVNFLASMAREPGLDRGDRLLAVTTLSFDIAVLELLLPLAVGAQVVIADAATARDPLALCDLAARSGITAMQATPTLWRTLLDAGWRGSGGKRRFKALIGGEALPPALAERLLACGVELWNMYGPTETTVWSTAWRVAAPREGISIGRPIDNTTVQVLDAHGHVCPIGVPGELCIGGAGVTAGYHRRGELTAERFAPDPDSAEPGARFYRTGDRGRWRHDGWLEHLGRMDRQVKVRGLRIELGEIEAVLQDHPAVAQGVVETRAGREDDVRLVAYVVPRSLPLDAAVLREHLRARLPEYMLPQYLVLIEALPLLPNGKIDRGALPAPQAETAVRPVAAPSLPTTAAERAIADIWCELLGIDLIDVDLRDNFFDLGGHSLLAMRAVVAIREKLGWKIQPPRFVYETLGQIAREENLSAS
jgi:amino acid adenylation domain-containing protein